MFFFSPIWSNVYCIAQHPQPANLKFPIFSLVKRAEEMKNTDLEFLYKFHYIFINLKFPLTLFTDQ